MLTQYTSTHLPLLCFLNMYALVTSPLAYVMVKIDSYNNKIIFISSIFRRAVPSYSGRALSRLMITREVCFSFCFPLLRFSLSPY